VTCHQGIPGFCFRCIGESATGTETTLKQFFMVAVCEFSVNSSTHAFDKLHGQKMSILTCQAGFS